MAKAKSKKKVVRAPRPRPALASKLDRKAMEYAMLLADPCGAPLVHPVYAGGDAGYLFRADSFFSVGNGAGQNAGIIHWAPGYSNIDETELLIGAGAGSSTALTVSATTVVPENSPGKLFLTANAIGVRCVAACMKVVYSGTEQNRSGRFHWGHTQAGAIDTGDLVSVDQLAPNLQHFSRTPNDKIEIVWKPGVADQEMNDPSAASNPVVRDRKSAITMAFAGVGNTIGVTVQCTAIYEWVPRVATGFATNATGKNTSRNTLDDVLDYLQSIGFQWTKGFMQDMVDRGTQQIIRTVAGAFGSMPAVPRRTAGGMAFLT